MNRYVIKIGDMYVSGDHKLRFNLSFTDDIEKAKTYFDSPQTKVINKGKTGYYDYEYIVRDVSTLDKAIEIASTLHGQVELIKKITTVSEVIFDAKKD